MLTDHIFLYVYLLLGPGAWAGVLALMLLGRRRMTRLLHLRAVLPPKPPRVSVVVPARDEAADIRRCIGRALAQDYPEFEVIAIDDRSSDGTGEILDELAAESAGQLKALHVAHGALPDGWLGKCHALHVATRSAEGEWLLFVDSDVMLRADALSRTLALALHRRYDAVSILTRLECHTFAERLVLPLIGGAWAVMNTVSLTNDDGCPGIAAANGQFFLIRRSAYETVGGHESVRDQITEDVELMRLLKGRGFRTRLMLGAHLAATRMHANLSQIFHGWARICAGSTRRRPWRILCAMAFVIVCGFSVYPALVFGVIRTIGWREPAWLLAASAHLALMSAHLALIYHWSGNRARYAWLFPAGGAALLAILLFALRICRTGRVRWRESRFQAPLPVHDRAPPIRR